MPGRSSGIPWTTVALKEVKNDPWNGPVKGSKKTATKKKTKKTQLFGIALSVQWGLEYWTTCVKFLNGYSI